MMPQTYIYIYIFTGRIKLDILVILVYILSFPAILFKLEAEVFHKRIHLILEICQHLKYQLSVNLKTSTSLYKPDMKLR